MKIVSACLAGIPCRYDCQAKERVQIKEWVATGQAVAVCPEQLGGLSTPRPPAERQADGRIRTQQGQDVTENYQEGARLALEIARTHHVTEAYLKSKSPMCGVGFIYDGTFQGHLAEGHGVFAAGLAQAGILVHQID